MPPQNPIIDAMVILQRRGRILLAERSGTGYADGQLNLPSGKVDPGENALDAAVREAREEVAIHLDPAALQPVHVMHYRNPEGHPRIGWFFAVIRWDGEPRNVEPHKCAGLSWHDPEHLPPSTVPYNALGITHFLKGEPFSVHGW